MKLKVHQIGDGPRTALLIHGAMASAGTWVRVAPLLAERGYTVLMPDLRGHGDSPKPGVYEPELFAADLVESLPKGADIALGHSLGALSLSLAVEELAPAKAVYSDPAWKLADNPMAEQIVRFAAQTKVMTGERIREMSPRWSDEDVEAELAGFAAWDTNAIKWTTEVGDIIPERAIVPSLVQAAWDRMLVTDDLAATLRSRGFTVVFVPETGHCVHRDDLGGFMASLDGWI